MNCRSYLESNEIRGQLEMTQTSIVADFMVLSSIRLEGLS